MMKSSFTLSKLDKVNLILKNYKPKIKRMIEILLGIEEIKKSKVFNFNISKIRFDISFCNDETIRKINKEYRFKDSSTDVITFSLFADDENSLVVSKTADLGQIIISYDTALKQKKDTIEKEILTLICHGILHLLGFDHLTKKDYDFVVRIQNFVLEEL